MINSFIIIIEFINQIAYQRWNPTQMKYFVKLAEELNYRGCEEIVHHAEHTLVEHQTDGRRVWHTTFRQNRKGTYLTDAGRVFVEFARRAISETEAGIRSMKEMKGIFTGRLHIGVTYSLHDILNDCILRFTERFPDACLSILESNSVKELEELVLKGELDFAFTYSSRRMSPLLSCYQLFHTPLCVIAHKNHPIATRHDSD